MLPLLAQLVAPPLQPGPVRLPGAGQQQTRPAPPPQLRPTPEATPLPAAPSSTGVIPRLRGFNPYSSAELSRILESCLSGKEPAAGLSNCAAVLSSRLFADGYINSRVITQPDPLPGELEVVAGRIEAIQVVSSSGRLQRRLQRLLAPLQGSVLRLPTLSTTLNQIQQLPGMGLLKINLNRIGEDSSRALLLVTAEPGTQPLRGELALRNDGSGGSGQFRGLATLVQNGALLMGDSLLLFGELNADSNPELGALNVMGLKTPETAILSAVIFNALIIVVLIPLALRGVKYRAVSADQLLKTNLLLYGVGGLIVPFMGIKAIDLILGVFIR
jgi:hemolysin activation/secretion protein